MWSHPAQRRGCDAEVGVFADVVDRVRCDDLAGHRALLLELVEQLGQPDVVVDHHAGVFGFLLEVRVLVGRPAEEDHLEPAVLGPAHV
jgi:hypothetical protein